VKRENRFEKMSHRLEKSDEEKEEGEEEVGRIGRRRR
jgi:hypothetical protein